MSGSRFYFDEELAKKIPNKYKLTPKIVRNLVVKDWDALKKETWYNGAMKSTGDWWCHLEGCQGPKRRYDDEDEFWIGFREHDGVVRFHFTCYGGMCSYNVKSFYNPKEIGNRYDMQVQANAISWLNRMIDAGILALPMDNK